jgi:EF hand
MSGLHHRSPKSVFIIREKVFMKRFVLYTLAVFLAACASIAAFAQSVTPADVTATQRRHHNPERRFQKLDTNNDGKITRDEWRGKPKAFDRLDLNHDGVITLDELQQARPRKK